MENRGIKRTAFSLKLENYDVLDDESLSRSPKRCKTYHEGYEENLESFAEEDCDKITIIVKDVKEKREVEINPDVFVYELREEISKDFKIPCEQISLYFNGQILVNENTLSNSNITDGSKVYLVKNSNKATTNHTHSLRSKKTNGVANKNSPSVYVVNTPDFPDRSAGISKKPVVPEELSQVEETEEESSASFENSTNVEGIVESMLALGHSPTEINLALFEKVFSCMDLLNSKIDKLDQNLKCVLEVLKQQADETKKAAMNETAVLHDKMVLLPPHVNLPLNTEDDLNYFEQLISTDDELASNMVKYFYQSAHGKSPCSFLLNVLRIFMSQELASGYSRFGRKGKKSFLPYKCTTDILLAAAAKKFSIEDRDSLFEKFGKALANAPEWNGRKFRLQMMAANDLNISESNETSN